MDPRIPFIVFGDGPRLHSGLARIARDVAVRLFAEEEELGIRVLQVGLDKPGGWHWQAWDFYGFQQTQKDCGRAALEQVTEELRLEHDQEPIILGIFDPSRLYDLTRAVETHLDYIPHEDHLQAKIWGYLPIDSHNVQEMIGGPAAELTHNLDRVLAYGPYGAGVLKRTLDHIRHRGPRAHNSVSWLPHGLEPGVFVPTHFDAADPAWKDWYRLLPPEALVVGCVATNQGRKDLGLLFAAGAQLRLMGEDVALWLHTDLMVKDWSIVQLAQDFLFPKDRIFVSTEPITDQQLAGRYAWSHVTLAPGLGEGFGYPIVESLACGTPCVHGNYAGGAELLPPMWRVEPVAWRLESCYALQRPVFDPAVVATVLRVAATHKRQDPDACRAYCSGSVEHLSWKSLWPRWRSWIRTGLRHG